MLIFLEVILKWENPEYVKEQLGAIKSAKNRQVQGSWEKMLSLLVNDASAWSSFFGGKKKCTTSTRVLNINFSQSQTGVKARKAQSQHSTDNEEVG